MVIQNDNETPVEELIIKKPRLEQKFYSAQTFVREVSNANDSKRSMDLKKIINTSESVSDGQVRKDKKILKRKQYSSTGDGCDDSYAVPCEISQDDLMELKSVYKKCKAVLNKIQSKYGHLLDLEEEPKVEQIKNTDFEEGECKCNWNKKIVFDDEGKEVIIDSLPVNHICPSKLKTERNHNISTENENLQILYHNNEVDLSDDLQELTKILQDPNIEKTFRNKVIDKVRVLRMEQLFEIKFNKHSLIEKLKLNPDEVLNFKGTNISTLIGYL